MLVGILNNIYRSKFFSALFHTQHHCLKKELSDCDSVLDIGCGPSSPIQYLQIKYSVGVEVFEPYYQLALKNKTHTLCLNDKIEDLEFAEKSFDAVVMIGVLEHFPKEYGEMILGLCNKWARKKIILLTPNGFIPQFAVDGNKYQEHLSGWDIVEYESLGYKVYGMAGANFLCKGIDETDTYIDDKSNNYFKSIKYRPKLLFFIINALCQMVMYYYPKHSLCLLAVKNQNHQQLTI